MVMKQTKTLKTVLWLSAFFMEAMALLFFFGTRWPVMAELAGDNSTVFGIEFLAGAILFTIAALMKKPARLFIGFLGGLIALCGIYFFELLLTQNWSAMATEVLVADTLFTSIMATLLFVQLRKTRVKAAGVYAS
jgi:hypothetical protein